MSVANKVIEQQKLLLQGIQDSVASETRKRIEGEIDRSLGQLNELSNSIVERDESLETLRVLSDWG